MYTDYVNEHEAASNALGYLNKQQKYQLFHEFCKDAVTHPMSKGLNIASLLITPIQRIPRYKLLLTELLKNTADDHLDKKNLEKAITIISATAKHINEAVRAFQNRKEIQQCMDEFVGSENLLEPHRKFIRKGELIRQTRNKPKPFKFYLFNDLLIYASPRGWKYRVHFKAPIDSQFQVEVYGTGSNEESCGRELRKTGALIKARENRDYPNMYLWQIVTKKKSFIVFATSPELGSSWVKDLIACKEAARRTITGRSTSTVAVETAPVWQPDSEARSCTNCGKPFGFIRRRHHCRKCGLLVCSDCSKNRAMLSWCPKSGKQRVCDKCIAVINPIVTVEAVPDSKTGSGTDSQTTSTLNAQNVLFGSAAQGSSVTAANATVGGARTSSVGSDDPSVPRMPPPQPRRDSEKKDNSSVQVRLPDESDEEDDVGSPSAKSFSRFKPRRFSILRLAKGEGDELKGDSIEGKEAFSVLSDWVWLPHSEQGFVAGKLVEKGDSSHTYRTIDGELVTLKGSECKGLRLAGQRVRDGDMEDLAMLSNKDFSEGSLLNVLRSRYKRDEIYTTMGGILVAINPNRMLNLYTMEILNKYKTAQPHELSRALPPHVFTVAAEAFFGLINDRIDQSVVISGESGSGKTETTKLILQFLSEVADSHTGVEQDLLQSNPLLEAFGNAKTVRNNNSSRFGKWMAINVAMPSGRICGGRIQHYLLEKTRVVLFQKNERNYHIFHQLCAFATSRSEKEYKEDDASKWARSVRRFVDGLDVSPAQKYHYTNQGGAVTLADYDDAEEFLHTMACMEQCGVQLDKTHTILQLITAVLHLGNIKAKPTGGPRSPCQIVSECLPDLEKAARFLGVSTKDLQFALENRTIMGKLNKKTEIPLTTEEAGDARDALAKAIYSGIFDWLVATVNKSLNREQKEMGKASDGKGRNILHIGVLDIFGFEVFNHNSLEQFFINYANEKLQQFFNQHVFKSEQALYTEEGLEVENVKFQDNQLCLNLIEGQPKNKKWGVKIPSLLKILQECVKMPNPTDEKMLQRMIDTHNVITSITNKNPNANPHFGIPSRKKKNKFTIKHYSGEVTYEVKGFLEKNRDHLHLSLKDILRGSSTTILNQLFPSEEDDDEKNPGHEAKRSIGRSVVQQLLQKEKDFKHASRKKSKKSHARAVHTLGSQFRGSIRSLINSLRETNPHFIRCIKPNSEKRPFHFHAPTVLRQMRNGGIVEALSIKRLGFPYRKHHDQFVGRYSSIQHLYDKIDTFKPSKKSGDPCSDLVAAISDLGKKRAAFKEHSIQMGQTRVFWTGDVRRALENWRQEGYLHSSTTIQAALRSMFLRQALITSVNERRIEENMAPSPPTKTTTPVSIISELEQLDKMKAGLGENFIGKDKELYEAVLKTSGEHILQDYQDLNPDYLKGLFLNRSSARKSRFVFQKGSIPSSQLKIDLATHMDKSLAKSEAKALKKKAISTFDNLLRYMKVKFHAYPVTTGFAVVSAGHSEPALRDEIFCQLIKQTTETPKNEWQLLGFRLIYLCLSAFMPVRCAPVLLSHLARFAKPYFEASLSDTANSVPDVATHCLRLFIANRQMQEMELKSKGRNSIGMNMASPMTNTPAKGEMYVTLELVRNVTKGKMVEDDEYSAED
uniref:Uncharacterized protein n=1 Tax=Amorphochlora amoebiformis TaxID=1561963 RepID=A0A7S0H256_9EUKA